MDRRGLLRGVLGAGLAAVTTKLWLPPASTALAQPERSVFLPPANGWPSRVLLGAVDLPGGSAYFWGANETAMDYLSRYYRAETTYDVETFGDVPSELFLLRPGDTVKVEFGPEHTAGFMVVQQIEQHDTGRTRLRGLGVESFIGSPLNPPLGTIRADRGKITRGLVD